MSQPFVGEIRMVGFNFAPNGWAFCNGQLLSISEFDVLFNLIGTMYGGDGQQTFAVPNLQSRIAVHQGDGFVIGQQAGEETVTLSLNQIPSHAHSLLAQAAAGTQPSPSAAFWAESPLHQYSSAAPSTTMATSLLASGGGQPHDNMGPFLVINFVISPFGIYPSQS